MTWKELCALAAALPEVQEDRWYGTPALKVRGKGFVRLKEDGESVVFLLGDTMEQELLIRTQPDLYFITDHYKGWPSVLARLAVLTEDDARERLEIAWLAKAPRTLVKRFESGGEGR